MTKRILVVGASLVALVMLLAFASGEERIPYDFQYDLGDTVSWDNNDWTVVSLMERLEGGNVFGYYQLKRFVHNQYRFEWVWEADLMGYESDPAPDCPPPGKPC